MLAEQFQLMIDACRLPQRVDERSQGHCRLVDRLFAVLVQPWVSWSLAALIVATASVAWASFRLRRMAPVLAGLERAISVVEASQGPSGFRRNFKSTYQRLAEDPVVGAVWRAYALTIDVASGTDDALVYSRRPHESFDELLLVVAGVNLRLYRAVPNLLVGCGLLFTFIGLLVALYFGSRAIGAGDITQAQHALHELLAAATFKFTTSIAGLGSSVVYSWREKALMYRVEYRLARFCTALEERMVPLTIAGVAARRPVRFGAQHAEQCLPDCSPIPDLSNRTADALGNDIGGEVGRKAPAVPLVAGLWRRLEALRSRFQGGCLAVRQRAATAVPSSTTPIRLEVDTAAARAREPELAEPG